MKRSWPEHPAPGGGRAPRLSRGRWGPPLVSCRLPSPIHPLPRGHRFRRRKPGPGVLPRHPPDPLRQLLPVPRPGPEEGRKGDLRLDDEADAKRERKGHRVIVDGNAEASELWRRLISEDPEERMPPVKLNRNLTAEQRAIVRLWIESGAKWGRHWPSNRWNARIRPRDETSARRPHRRTPSRRRNPPRRPGIPGDVDPPVDPGSDRPPAGSG